MRQSILTLTVYGLALCSAGILFAEELPFPGSEDLSPVKVLVEKNGSPVPLFRNGVFIPKLQLPEKPSQQLRRAAEVFAWCVERMTGKRPVVVSGKTDGPSIVLGDCPEAKAAGLDGSKMPVEGFSIKTVGNRIFIVGNDTVLVERKQDMKGKPEILSRGTEWGVYDFLERVIGCRFYFEKQKGGWVVPKIANLEVPAFAYSDAPVFLKREIYPFGGKNMTGVPELQTALRSNDATTVRLRVHDPRWSGEYPPGTLDEIFQRQSNGKRTDSHMLCYGNPRTLQEYLNRIDEELAGKRDSRLIVGNSVTVSPWDLDVTCTCEHCRKLFEPEKGATGSASRILCAFVQNLSRELAKRHPEMKIIFLPYMNYTDLPEGIRFGDNVEVQLASKVGLAYYKEPTVREAEERTIRKWSDALNGRPIQHWHYSCWPAENTSAPLFYPDVIVDFYKRNGKCTQGSFVNGTRNHWPQTGVSLYVWQKALWNPDLNVDRILDTMCERLYGPAAAPMREIYELQRTGWEKNLWGHGIMTGRLIFEKSFPGKDVVRMEALFAEAEKKAGTDPAVLQRIAAYKEAFLPFFEESKAFAEGTRLTPLSIMKTGENPKIDGVLDDPQWKNAPEVSFVRALDRKNKIPKYPTTVKAVWTPDGVTFGFRMTEPNADKLVCDRGGKDTRDLWWNDNIEIFLDVTGENTGDFYQFIFTASNRDIFDSYKNNPSWDAAHVQYKAARGKDFWSLEVFIPFREFKNNPKAKIPETAGGIRWTGNFTRHRVAGANEKENEYTRMNTTYANFSNNGSDFAVFEFKE